MRGEGIEDILNWHYPDPYQKPRKTMKYLTVLLPCALAPYLFFVFLLKDLNPLFWPEPAIQISLAATAGFYILAVLIMRGLDAEQREADKYFNDRTHE